MKFSKQRNGRKLYPKYNPVTRAIGKRVAGLSGAALGYITNNLPGLVGGYNLGYGMYKRRYRQRWAPHILASNRVAYSGPPTGSNPGHRFGSNPRPKPNPQPTKSRPTKLYYGKGRRAHGHRYKRYR